MFGGLALDLQATLLGFTAFARLLALLLTFTLRLGALVRQGGFFDLFLLRQRLRLDDRLRNGWRRFGHGCGRRRRLWCRQADQLGMQHAGGWFRRCARRPTGHQQDDGKRMQTQRRNRRCRVAIPTALGRGPGEGLHGVHGQAAHCGASVTRPRLATPPFCRAAMPATTLP
ncbi:hypothetical protein D3C80_1620800 [compost metagenome]